MVDVTETDFNISNGELKKVIMSLCHFFSYFTGLELLKSKCEL